MRFALLLLFLSLPVLAQSGKPFSISVGAKIGAPLNDPKQTTVTQGRWTGGPSVELRLPARFALEFNALYRTSRTDDVYSFQFSPGSNSYLANTYQRAGIWDFPLLLKYRFNVGPLRPFVSAGYSWSRSSSESIAVYRCTGPQGSCLPSGEGFFDPRNSRVESSRFQKGSPVVGGGLEFKTRYLTIAPEVRFDRPRNEYPISNRFTALVGFT
ncbi:MAG: outer membrane beta-barrel protein [Acidobacteria bacterium]|nr:outer membrane beta-barrel protein [Acidobacteriota bacterium]